MKTVSKNGEYLRLNESEAESKVKSGWKYTPKSEWKENVRGVRKNEKTEKEEQVKKEKTKKEKKS